MKWEELLQDKNGRVSRTGLMFMVWMVFFMTIIGIITIRDKNNKLADIPEPYVYITLVLCGTYTARRFLDNKFGTAAQSQAITPPNEPKA